MFHVEIVAGLNNMGERPWHDLIKGERITERELSRLLRPYGVRFKVMRIGEEVCRGIERTEMNDLFSRYISMHDVELLKQESRELNAAFGA